MHAACETATDEVPNTSATATSAGSGLNGMAGERILHFRLEHIEQEAFRKVMFWGSHAKGYVWRHDQTLHATCETVADELPNTSATAASASSVLSGMAGDRERILHLGCGT